MFSQHFIQSKTIIVYTRHITCNLNFKSLVRYKQEKVQKERERNNKTEHKKYCIDSKKDLYNYV